MDDARAGRLSERLGARVGRRRRGAAEALAAATPATPTVIAALAGALADGADNVAARIAEQRLGQLTEQSAIDAAWRVWSASRGERLLSALIAAPTSPSKPELRALFLFLTARWERFEELDSDLGLLSAAYERADPGLRARLAAHARKTGRREWIQVVVGDRRRQRLSALSDREWDTTITLLDRDEAREELWRLAQAAPPLWAARMLQALTRADWQPRRHADRERFVELAALAAKCGEAPPPKPVFAQPLRDHVGFSLFAGENCFAFSPDGSVVAIGSATGWVRLWRVADGRPHATAITRRTRPDVGGVLCLAFSPDGDLFATGSHGPVRLWRAADSAAHAIQLEGGSSSVRCLRFSPDGSLLATARNYVWEFGEDFEVRLWRTADGGAHARLEGYRSYVRYLAFSPDGSLLATSADDDTVRLWRTADGVPHATLEGDAGGYLEFSPDGRLLATSSDDGVRLWRTADGAAHATLEGYSGYVRHLAFSPDGGLLATTSDDDTLRLWRTADGAAYATVEGGADWVIRVACIPNRRYVGALLAATSSGHDYGRVRAWWLWQWLLRQAVTDLAAADLRILEELRGEGGVPAIAQAWLELTAALVRWRKRHEIAGVQSATRTVVAGELDIETEGDAPRE